MLKNLFFYGFMRKSGRSFQNVQQKKRVLNFNILGL